MTVGLAPLSPAYLVSLMLMSVRLGTLIISAPVFGARTVPAMTKIGLAVAVAVVVMPIASQQAILPSSIVGMLVAVVKEMLVGLLAGFAVTLLFASIEIVSSLAGIQIGFGFSGTVGSSFAGQSSAIDHLFAALSTLVFLAGNFHHQVLIGVQGLFETIPVNGLSLARLSPDGLIAISAEMLLSAARIVFPLLGALLLTELAMGVLARTAPQINIFFVGMPVKIGVGIYAIAAMLPFVVVGMERLFANTAIDLSLVFRYR